MALTKWCAAVEVVEVLVAATVGVVGRARVVTDVVDEAASVARDVVVEARVVVVDVEAVVGVGAASEGKGEPFTGSSVYDITRRAYQGVYRDDEVSIFQVMSRKRCAMAQRGGKNMYEYRMAMCIGLLIACGQYNL